MKAEYISPHEGTGWHPNDFCIGEQYVTDDKVFTVVDINRDDMLYFYLIVEWDDKSIVGDKVCPNAQWIALNWTEDEDSE